VENFCEILYCPETREAALVDPAWEVDRLLKEAERLGLRVVEVLVTHTHHDHIEGVAEVVARTGATARVHPHSGAPLRAAAPGALLQPVDDRQNIPLGRRGLRALETFGHTVGGTSYLSESYVITGDVLFVRGCGRTDFPGGSTAALWDSLQ